MWQTYIQDCYDCHYPSAAFFSKRLSHFGLIKQVLTDKAWASKAVCEEIYTQAEQMAIN